MREKKQPLSSLSAAICATSAIMNLPTETFNTQSVVANKGEERKMNRSLSILTGIILSATLIGCSSSDEVDQMQQLTNKVDMLSDQVGALQSQQDQMAGAVNDARAASDAAYQEAMRANQRIDNIASSYSK
ncbi:Lpp/OprI family alanine-zipper lipoprotein (plasmid) [Photobacterium sp. DA100]|nr:Lpp/OprI family alanine-zipper lipoprotein [Photobacterium sp. DA100]WEM45594.1 Lpp/OprI family alanine-zipper lipoprotein [Photobacterium sp. DA100]